MTQSKYSLKFVGSPELSEEDKLAIAGMTEEQLESALQAHHYSVKLLEEHLRQLHSAQHKHKKGVDSEQSSS